MAEKIVLEIEVIQNVTLSMDYDDIDKHLGEYQQVICEEDERDEMFKHIAEMYVQGNDIFIEGIGELRQTSIEVEYNHCDCDILDENIEED